MPTPGTALPGQLWHAAGMPRKAITNPGSIPVHRHGGIKTVKSALFVTLSLLNCKPGYTHALVRIETDIPVTSLAAVRLRCAYNWNGFDPHEFRSCNQTLA